MYSSEKGSFDINMNHLCIHVGYFYSKLYEKMGEPRITQGNMIFHQGRINSVQDSSLTRHSAGLTLRYMCVCEPVREGGRASKKEGNRC